MSAAERVTAYLDAREARLGLDAEHIADLDGGTRTGGTSLLTTDLRHLAALGAMMERYAADPMDWLSGDKYAVTVDGEVEAQTDAERAVLDRLLAIRKVATS